MPQVLVRDLDTATLRRLKSRAEEHGRSLQNELKQILEDAARMSPAEMRSAADRIRRSLSGRRFGSSTVLVREDRER